ncbi:hypothetical protein AAHA92_02105 [Salvia divinorum]|uniref:Uncharacterized protein n=1 Tax=Salvia divinorum TaxID=28513 RepID=A0ABD1IFH4_SALDI
MNDNSWNPLQPFDLSQRTQPFDLSQGTQGLIKTARDGAGPHWAQIVKQDRNARFMRFKSWPMWEDWKLIFGKDRATGDVSEDSHDSYNVYNVPNKADSGVGGADFSADPACHSKTTHSKTTPSPQQDPLGTPDESTGQSKHASQQSKKNEKKRKAPSDLVGLIDVLKKMQEDTNLRLDKLTR